MTTIEIESTITRDAHKGGWTYVLLPGSSEVLGTGRSVRVGGTIDEVAIEATLSYLGIGLQEPAISWGVSISDASGLGYVRSAPHMLLFPSLFLSLAVLAFIFLGEAAQSAFDPKRH